MRPLSLSLPTLIIAACVEHREIVVVRQTHYHPLDVAEGPDSTFVALTKDDHYEGFAMQLAVVGDDDSVSIEDVPIDVWRRLAAGTSSVLMLGHNEAVLRTASGELAAPVVLSAVTPHPSPEAFFDGAVYQLAWFALEGAAYHLYERSMTEAGALGAVRDLGLTVPNTDEPTLVLDRVTDGHVVTVVRRRSGGTVNDSVHVFYVHGDTVQTIPYFTLPAVSANVASGSFRGAAVLDGEHVRVFAYESGGTRAFDVARDGTVTDARTPVPVSVIVGRSRTELVVSPGIDYKLVTAAYDYLPFTMPAWGDLTEVRSVHKFSDRWLMARAAATWRNGDPDYQRYDAQIELVRFDGAGQEALVPIVRDDGEYETGGEPIGCDQATPGSAGLVLMALASVPLVRKRGRTYSRRQQGRDDRPYRRKTVALAK